MSKKLIILTLLCSFYILPVIAEESVEIKLDKMDVLDTSTKVEEKQAPVPSDFPKWEEFCETGYENAKLLKKDNIFNVINFVDAGRTKSNYWAERRINFKKAVDHCNTLTDNSRSFCYDGVRKTETERNEMYEQQRKQINYKNRGIVIDKPNY